MTKQIAKRPTHRVYAVTERAGADKAFWTTIGAAWPHRDGRGLQRRAFLHPPRQGAYRHSYAA